MTKILLADDHGAIRHRLKQILLDEHPHLQIEEVLDGNGLIKRALGGKWDLVIADISMPEVNGLQALRHIRLFNPSLPVLLLSIYCDDDYAAYAIRAGASAYLCKEAAHQELLPTINRLVAL